MVFQIYDGYRIPESGGSEINWLEGEERQASHMRLFVKVAVD